MEGCFASIFELLFGLFLEGLAERISDRIADTFGIGEHTPARRNLKLVVSILLALVVFGGMILLLARLTAA